MDIGVANISVREAIGEATVKVNVSGIRLARVRLALAKPFFYMGSFIAGFGAIEIGRNGGVRNVRQES